MTVAWPSSIVITQMLPLSVALVEQRHVFQPEEGEAIIAPASTGTIYAALFDVMMTGANVQNDFLAWWETTLRQGAETFTGLESVIDDGAATYQFQDAPTFTLLRGSTTPALRLWRSTFSLWQIATSVLASPTNEPFDDLSIGESGQRWADHFIVFNSRTLSGNADEGFKATDGYPAALSGTIGQALASYNGGIYGAGPFLHDVSGGTLKMRCYAGCTVAQWGDNTAGIRPQLYGYPAAASMITQELSYNRGPYGYWKIRLRVNSLTKSQHFALWMLSASGAYPPEIDILERVDDGGFTVGKNFHYTHKRVTDPDPTVIGVDYYTAEASNWHVYSMEVNASWLIHRVDDIEIKRTQNIFTDINDWYLLMSWEVGNTWAGDPDGSTVWPGEVELDYVQIYPTRAASGDVTPPFVENWTGTNGAAWDASRWTTPSFSTSSVIDIQSNQGRMAPGGLSYDYVRTDALMTVFDFELTATFQRSTNGEQYHTIYARCSGQSLYNITEPADCYAFVISDTGASVTFQYYEVTASNRGTPVDVAKTWGTSAWNIKIRCVGSSLRARVWQGGTEPSTWDIDQTDATRQGGTIRFAAVSGAPATTRPILWDSLVITEVVS